MAPKRYPPEMARPEFREPKVLSSIFFDSCGPVAQIPVPKGGRMTSEFYAENCFGEVETFYKKRRPIPGARGIKLSHDNATPLMSKIGRETIEDIGFEVIDHPPFRQISPCDF